MRIEEIRAEVDRRAAIISAPAEFLPTYGDSDGTARPHIEVHGPELSWVVQERGTEFERRTTTDLDDLLYWIFDAITLGMASTWESQHRVPYTEPRIVKYAWQLALLARLDPAWRGRRRPEQIRQLTERPHANPPPLGPGELRDLRSFLQRAPQGLSDGETAMLGRITSALADRRPLTRTQRNFMLTGLAARGLEINGLTYGAARELMEQGPAGVDRFDPDIAVREE